MTTTNKTPLPNLLICVLLDAVGMMSFTLPLIGDFGDVIWAPLSAIIYMKMFGGKMGIFGGAFSFLEEILPVTDIIPTFTLSWFLRKRELDKIAKPNNVIVVKANN